jgi:hypothetical protein
MRLPSSVGRKERKESMRKSFVDSKLEGANPRADIHGRYDFIHTNMRFWIMYRSWRESDVNGSLRKCTKISERVGSDAKLLIPRLNLLCKCKLNDGKNSQQRAVPISVSRDIY